MKGKKLAVLIGIVLCVFFQQRSLAQTETRTFPSGTAIIDMGSSTPTIGNSLKPYGLIYALLKNHYVPVYCVINQGKVKDGIDFVYNNKSYKGGTFIVSSDFFTPAVTTLLTSWAGQGVLIDYTNTTTDLTVDVSYKLNFAPKWVMDRTNGNIAVNFLSSAGIPSSAYSFKSPYQLGDCDDIFILPHADPTWQAHRNLYFWNRTQRGAIWAGCHAVSMLENITKDTTIGGTATQLQMNFLSTNGLVPFTDHNSGSLPYFSQNPADPMAQYIGKTDNAQIAGSETVFLPKIGSAWRTDTKMITSSPVQPDIPALSAGPAAVNIYGRGFGNPTGGYVCYQASHNIADDRLVDNIAAQRIFFNFSLVALNDKVNSKISASISGVPDQLRANTASPTLTATVSGDGGPFTYQWKSNIAGTFSNPGSATTSFTPSSSISSATKCIITLIVTDANCSRISFDQKKTTVIAQVPPLNAATINKNMEGACGVINPLSFNVLQSNVDNNAGTRTLVSVTNLSSGTVLTTTSGDITYTPFTNFTGTDAGTYTLSNGSSTVTGTVNITVGNAALIPVAATDAATIIVDNVASINVLANDLNNMGSTTNDKLFIRDITKKPANGYVYINADKTVSYLSTKELHGVTADDFKYLACNDQGYCAVGTVNITLTPSSCATGLYQTTVTSVTTAATFTPTEDTYIVQVGLTANDSSSRATQGFFRLSGQTSQQRRPLMKFNVSSIASNATINSATLKLIVGASGMTINGAGTNNPFPATVYAVTKPWTSNATWFEYDGTNAWNTAGGSIAVSGGDLTDISGNNPTFADNYPASSVTAVGTAIQATITGVVSAWVASGTNNGLMIVPRNPTATFASPMASFLSREDATESNRPLLSVNYTVPPACNTIPTNYKPIAYPDTISTASEQAVIINAKSNDANYYSHINGVVAVGAVAHGTATINANNKIVYTPNAGFVGTEEFTYTIADSTDLSLTHQATVRVTVTRIKPKVNADRFATNSNTAITYNIGANDEDQQGAMDAPVITVTAKNGTVSISNTSVVYTPNDKFTGKDTLIYSRAGTNADACTTVLSDTAIVYITVNNQPPVAVNDTISTFACTTTEIDSKPNDSDPEGTFLTPVIVSNPANGTVVLNANGKFSYSPNASFTGTDQFTYKLKDGSSDSLQSNTATVVIQVSGSANPNIAPKAVADNDSTWVNTQVIMNVLQNDSDPNKDPFSINITAAGLKAPQNGTLQLLVNKMIRYTPNPNFVGRDTFEYQITDVHPGCTGNTSLSAKARVIVKVRSLPIFTSGTIWNDENLSGKEDFTDIYTSPETGTNADGSIYVYLVDSTNSILDYTPVDNNGTYLLSNVPSFTPKLKMILSTATLSVGKKLAVSSLPSGYTNTSPTIRTFNAGSADITGYDWGIVTSTVSPGTITTTTEAYCINITTVGALTSISSPTAGAGMQWQASTISAGSGFVDIANATATAYTPAAPVTSTTWYRRKATLGIQPPVYSNVITLSPLVSIAGTIENSGLSICAAVNSGTLTLSGYSGSILKWQSSTDGGGTYTDITHTDSVYNFNNLNATTRYRALVQMSTCSIATTEAVTVTVNALPVIGAISGPCALARDSSGIYKVTPTGTVTHYVWQLSSGWTGSSDSSSIKVKAGIATGALTVTAFNGACAGNSANNKLTVIDYAKVTISATPVVASGNLTSTMVIKIQLIDTDGNNIACSGGAATLCTTSGSFGPVVDHNDGTYSSLLTSTANTPEICGTVGGIPIQKKIVVTFTGPQGGIKGNGPILATETPKLTFTMTAGSGPFTVIYRSAKSTKNDTLTNVISGKPNLVAQIPSTTLYTLVSIIDANGERRDNNFNRDTASVVVLAPKIIVTLKSDAPVIERDSTWRTRLTLHVKNIGDLDLANVQVKLNLQDVFPSPVTYVLDSVRVSGTTVVQNPNYNGLQHNDLFARNRKKPVRIDAVNGGALESAGVFSSLNSAIDAVNAVEVYGSSTTIADEENGDEEDGSRNYMFGASSQLPIGVDGFMYLYLHIRPNGYYEPFVMQAVALGTGHTDEGAALTTSLSNDNENTAAHPDITLKGDPLPTVINLIPNPVIGASLTAGVPVNKGDGSYDVQLSYRLRNYGNVNLQSIQVFQNLGRMIGSPSTFTVVGGVSSTGTLVPNPSFDARTDSSMLLPVSELAYGAEGTLQFKINIRPNQLSALYRLQATATGTYNELNIKYTDLSNDGTDPDPDGNKIPSERVITIIAINQPIPPLVPGTIGIDTIPPARATVVTKKYCTSVTGAVIVSTSSNRGGTGAYEWQWQGSTNNTSFTDIAGATDSVYTTGTITSNFYLRRRIISDNQVAYSNSVYIQVVAPVKPVITPGGPLTLPFNGTLVLSSSTAATYTWSTGASGLSITIALPGTFTVTTKDANACTATSDPVTVKPPPPQTVDATYILGNIGNPASSGVQVTAMNGATLNYYMVTSSGALVPVPALPAVVGVYTYYVSETLNGVESDRVPYKVTIIDKVADIEKQVSKAPVLQQDGSFLQTFSIRVINKRSELLDSVRVKDDLSKVFPAGSTFEVTELKASGKLVANTLYNGSSQTDLLAAGSQLPGLQTDSILLSVKLYPNGFTGELNNPAELTAKSPFGVVKLMSNDPKASDGRTVRAPAKFNIPGVDIFIPSGFSPNHDGTNDVWAISKPYNTKLTVDVFNRWGNLVFRSPEYKNEFNGKGNQAGTVMGEDLPDGTYYYIVIATDKTTGATRKFAGYLTLKR